MKRPHPHPLFPPRSICADYIQYTLHSLSQLAPGNPPWYFTLLNMFNSHKQADTPGCTNQACGFRDHLSEIKELGYDIYGLSKDKPAALKRVCPLSLPLLLSPDLSHSYMNRHHPPLKHLDMPPSPFPLVSWADEKWKTKKELNYTLLSDPESKLIKRYVPPSTPLSNSCFRDPSLVFDPKRSWWIRLGAFIAPNKYVPYSLFLFSPPNHNSNLQSPISHNPPAF